MVGERGEMGFILSELVKSYVSVCTYDGKLHELAHDTHTAGKSSSSIETNLLVKYERKSVLLLACMSAFNQTNYIPVKYTRKQDTWICF